MQLIPFSLGLLSCSIGLVSSTALPDLEARDVGPCVNNQRTIRFGFDALPTGQPPRDGLGQLHWNNWLVQSTDSTCSGQSNTCIPPKPQGGKNFIVSNDANALSISKANTEGFSFFTLNSFYFGCAQFGSFGLIPEGCTLQVVSKVFSAVDTIRTNTYNYTGSYENPAMMKVDYRNGGSNVYFSVVEGRGSSVLYLDSFEVVQPCGS